MKKSKNPIAKKLAIGTANFNTKYGINNKKKFLSKKSIKNIFKILQKEKILYLDTAKSYKNTEKSIGNLKNKKIKIITKIKKINTKNNKYEFIKKEVSQSISDLKIKKLYGLLIHNPRELRKDKGYEIYKSLKKLKKEGMVKKIGYSINSPKDLNFFYTKYKPDLIQTPINVFDQRIVESGWLKKMKKDNVEIHARSIFLQGLLLKKNIKLIKKFNKFSNSFNKWNIWLKKNNLSKLNGCLNYIFSIKEINKVIVGVDSVKHLKDILKFRKKNYLNFSFLKSNEANLITPSRWQKL